MREKAHLKVLQHLAVVAPYIDEHLAELREHNSSMSDAWINKEHNSKFVKWLRYKVKSQLSETVNETVKWLANGPMAMVCTWQGYDMNGFTWYTKQQDGKSTVQNSGVTVVAGSSDGSNSMSYYGKIEEIWELDYMKFTIPLFLCEWVDNRRGVKIDDYGIISVDFNRLGYKNDPFILANKEAKHVFYIVDSADKKWHVVLPSKRRIVGVGDVVDEEEYDQFDEIPPFSTGIEPITVEVNDEPNHLRSDHEEGVFVKQQK